MKNGYRVTDLEHHFITQDMMDEYTKLTGKPSLMYVAEEGLPGSMKKTIDVGDFKIEEMDKAGVDFAQISATNEPGAESFPVEMSKHVAAVLNDSLAEAIAAHPDRFGGWISLAPADPKWCEKEVDRALEMGLYGWATMSNYNGEYLDDPKYWPVLEKIEDTGMPIYLHPMFPTAKEYTEFGYCIAGPSLGFMVDTSLCFMRMIHRGVFDRFPKLKIILGHDGEAFPFLKNRMNTAWRQNFGKPFKEFGEGPAHEPSYYLEHNVWITTSGNYLHEALRCCLDVMAEGRVMYSSDYPYEDFAAGVSFIADNDRLTDAEKRTILADNAAALGFGPKK